MEKEKPILLSGIKPTGTPHIGNYFGAIKQLVEFQTLGSHQCYIMVADYHALNFVQNAGDMRDLTRELVLTYMAAGLNPEKVVLFKQSDVPAHTELAWIFDTITTMPYLMRAHAYKDAEAKNKEISVGTFNYPMLMAADILLYDTARVPVGQDQKQHIEYARDTAEKFNRIFGEVFTLPEEHIVPEVAIVPGIDGQKMSKSYNNTIPLFATRHEIEELVMSIVTDSSGDRPENVYAIHKLVKSERELEPLYEEHKGKYKALKEALIEDLDAFIAPMRERYHDLNADPRAVTDALEAGGHQARERANRKIEEVRRAIGVS
ncbi:MAG TPA: tryptophan--tRNA ligase [Candidatus Paceibacterota bacterium]|nr:tryptophan--tRNA ligase [Candidatus Paceibacterota bacterium]